MTGNLKRLEDTLVSVLQNRPEKCQVVVVLNQPYEDPYELDGEVDFVQAPSGAGLVECFDWGVTASKAPIVHMIAAGVEATANWTDAAMSHFVEPDVAAVAPLIVDRVDRQRVLSAGLHYTSAGAICRIASRTGRPVASPFRGPDPLASFYRKSVLDSIEAMPHIGSELVAATDCALAVRQAGFHCAFEPESLLTGSRDLLGGSSAWREGIAAERLYRRWAKSSEAHGSWSGHAGLIALELLQCPLHPSMMGRLAGRLWANLGFGGGDSRHGIEPFSRQRENVSRPSQFNPADSHGSLPTRAAG